MSSDPPQTRRTPRSEGFACTGVDLTTIPVELSRSAGEPLTGRGEEPVALDSDGPEGRPLSERAEDLLDADHGGAARPVGEAGGLDGDVELQPR